MKASREFLNRLVGEWDLTGQMGQVPLHQTVTGVWTLGGLYVQLYFRSTLPESRPGRPPYEAVYFVGYQPTEDVYVLHQLDTSGVSTESYPGQARREADRLPFVFHYPSGPFTILFDWEPEAGAWRLEQTYLENGETKTFAIRRMVPVRVS